MLLPRVAFSTTSSSDLWTRPGRWSTSRRTNRGPSLQFRHVNDLRSVLRRALLLNGGASPLRQPLRPVRVGPAAGYPRLLIWAVSSAVGTVPTGRLLWNLSHARRFELVSPEE